MTWHAIVSCRTAAEARVKCRALAATFKTPQEAAEHVSPALVREVSPDKGWLEPIPPAIAVAWRARLEGFLAQRWEACHRRTLIDDVINAAAESLESEANRIGVRLPRSAKDTLIDAMIQRRRGE